MSYSHHIHIIWIVMVTIVMGKLVFHVTLCVLAHSPRSYLAAEGDTLRSPWPRPSRPNGTELKPKYHHRRSDGYNWNWIYDIWWYHIYIYLYIYLPAPPKKGTILGSIWIASGYFTPLISRNYQAHHPWLQLLRSQALMTLPHPRGLESLPHCCAWFSKGTIKIMHEFRYALYMYMYI